MKFFVAYEKFSFFSWLLKFYGVRGCVRLFYDPWGVDFFEWVKFFVDFSWIYVAVASFLRPNVFRGFFVDLRCCGFLSETENFSFFSWIYVAVASFLRPKIFRFFRDFSWFSVDLASFFVIQIFRFFRWLAPSWRPF